MSRPPIRTTHTCAELEVSASTYDEIAAKLRAADYDFAFMDGGAIDMHGIGLTRSTTKDTAITGELEDLFGEDDDPGPLVSPIETHDGAWWKLQGSETWVFRKAPGVE